MTNASPADITRTCILSQIPTQKWIKLLKQQIPSDSPQDKLNATGEAMCQVLLSLMPLFPSLALINEYLSAAIDNGLIPFSSFIHAFPDVILATLEFAHQPELVSRTLSFAINPYTAALADSSKKLPEFLSHTDSPLKNAKTVEAVIGLLRLSYTLPGSLQSGADTNIQSAEQPLQIAQTLSSLLLLLLSAISPPAHPPIPPDAAASLITSLAELTQMYPLPHEAQSAIDDWILRVTISSGSMALGEGFDILGGDIPNITSLHAQDNEAPAAEATEDEAPPAVSEEEDITAPVTILLNLLECRGSPVHGPSSLTHATSLLLAAYRSTAIAAPQQHRRAASTASPAPGATHNRTHTAAGSVVLSQTPQGVTPRFQARTPATGATPYSHSVVHSSGGVSLGGNATTPGPAGNSSMLHQAHTPGGLVATAAHTPGVRTPGNIPRTPGTIGKVTTSPPSMRSNKPSQARAQLFFEKLLLAASVLVADAENIEDILLQEHAPSDRTNTVPSNTTALRRSLVLGRLPMVLARFQQVAGASSSSSPAHRPNFAAALETALGTLFSCHGQTLDACDPWTHTRPKAVKAEGSMVIDDDENAEAEARMNEEGSRGSVSYRQLLLTSLARHQLISAEFASNLYAEFSADHRRDRTRSSQLDHDEVMRLSSVPGGSDMGSSPQRPGLQNQNHQQKIISLANGLMAEAQDAGFDIESYCELKMSSELLSDIIEFFDRVVTDFGSHAAVAATIEKRFSALSSTADLKPLSELSNALYSHKFILDVVSLHVPVVALVTSGLVYLNELDMESIGDPQMTYTYLGHVALFLQSCLYRYNLSKVVFTTPDGRALSSGYPAEVAVYHPSNLATEERNILKNWLNTVFAVDMEGVSDNLLRSTHPKVLLRLAGTLFVQAISGASRSDDLRSGAVSYFLGPLLNWTLPGVVRGLAEESLRKGYRAKIDLDVLQALLMDHQCPKVVLQISAASVLRLMSEPIMEPALKAASFNVPVIQKLIREAMGGLTSGPSFNPLGPKGLIKQFVSNPHTTSAPPSLSSLLYYPTQEVLEAVFAVLFLARLPDYQPAARNLSVALFNLPSPSPTATRAVLPFFLSVFLPGKLPWMDHQPTAEKTRAVSIMVALASSSLVHALRMERALRDISSYDAGNSNKNGADSDSMEIDEKGKGPETIAMGRTSGLATNFSKRLKVARSSSSAKLIHQQLLSNPSFASNFPSFAA